MSVVRPRSVACPACGQSERRRVAQTVNGARAPEMRRAILEGTFQRLSCPSCGRVARADGPLLYLDLPAKQWIGCFPRAWEAAWRELELEPLATWRRVLIDRAPEGVREAAGDYAVRTVFGIPSLREKLLCWDAGLDDAWLEVLKLDLVRGGEPLSLAPSARPLLDGVEEGRLIFTADLPGEGNEGGPSRFAVPRPRLDEITTAADAWASARAEIAAGPYVDLGRLLLGGTDPSPWTGASGAV